MSKKKQVRQSVLDAKSKTAAAQNKKNALHNWESDQSVRYRESVTSSRENLDPKHMHSMARGMVALKRATQKIRLTPRVEAQAS